MIGFQFRTRQPGYVYQLRSAGVMLMQAAPLMMVLFLLFPRVQGPLWGMPQDAYSGVTGLSEDMSPGSVSNLLTSDAVAFRVNFESAAIPTTQQLDLARARDVGFRWTHVERIAHALRAAAHIRGARQRHRIYGHRRAARQALAVRARPARQNPAAQRDDERLSGAVSGHAQRSPALRHDFAPALPRCGGVAAL